MQDFDDSVVLGATPGLEVLVSHEGFAFLAKEVDVREASLIVCKVWTSAANSVARSPARSLATGFLVAFA